jgi:hypothetical protein
VGWFPNNFLKRIATKGLMPVADKALQRPVMGNFFNLVAGNAYKDFKTAVIKDLESRRDRFCPS